MTVYVPAKSAALGKLKVCITLLVVMHHSMLAYGRFAHFDRLHYLRSSAPIVDHDRWIGFDLIVDFNDVYFMSLMFLISGLFVMPSLSRRGPWNYLAGRAIRLGLPFLAAVTIIMPVAYYPSYLQTGATLSFPQYWLGYFTAYGWPGGPAWFIWVLLVLDALVVAVVSLRPALLQEVVAIPDWLMKRPYAGFAIFLAMAAASYLSMSYAFGSTLWFSWGPFAIQASRVLLYTAFFMAGTALGAAGTGHALLARTGPIARAWGICTGLALIAFGGLVAIQLAALRHAPITATLPWHALGASLFVLVCVFTSLALVGGFIRYFDTRRRWLDLLAPCAFGIYIVHYAPLTWLQMALLSTDLPAIIKAGVVVTATLATSWVLVALLRQAQNLRPVL